MASAAGTAEDRGHGVSQVLFQDFIDAFEFYCENMAVNVACKSVSATTSTTRDNKSSNSNHYKTVISGQITASFEKYVGKKNSCKSLSFSVFKPECSNYLFRTTSLR